MHVEEVADIKKIFEEFDEDHSGGISLEELKKAIKSLKATICPEDRVVRATAGHLSLCPVSYAGTQRARASLIFALRKSIPKYTRKDFKDGKELDEDAFRKLILAVKTGALIEDVQKSDEEIRALFNKIDTDGSGFLDEKELKTAMDSTPTSERADYAEHWARMLGYADKDVGGKKEFSFEAFLKLTDDLNLGRFATSS
ncbi:hypothetical protein Ctob_003886 [Chrysochromulina tobinii]|uniref:EF-hand domain-containing protein n=1 Tax=Chrysochromulina tobinii TaxID=1460289 RepID=A0A0M0JR28_9EUKA|nr:hypothetical protein Ctob_003886 [Chrysochromulina tobinii]|eukprot:KOO29041.1 hypothetical protein Ctob_003886 [Chrysochromulina sp. CCMP291]